ncbi:TonB-dependent receptor [Sphingosinicella sp. CPCC 101087]|uniref:TonB-dependent receptor n=1 Tax=Sphingosinicella sp. CPCC 101087 TaxID=2497754 RepID=UPI00101DDD73|nr:TonB-dependent receptor [Sphingosinicella sp. CPCC 101087]
MTFKPIGFLAGLLSSAAAFAQTPETQSPPPEQAPPPTATPGGEQEILVTAQRREQALEDVSLAVTAVDAQRLQDAQVNNLQDLQAIVPTVNFGSDFNQAKIFIRGVGANTSTTGNSTGVALHVDGAVVARAEAQLTSLFDLERVEVLRGPQGTLYGRNTTGGSINLITAKPTRDFSGYGRVTYGNYDAFVTEAALSGPITGGILFRVATKTEDRDGFGVNPVNGVDVDDLDRQMARAHLQFDMGPDLTLLLTGEYFRQNDNSGALHFLRASFPGVPRLFPLGQGGYAERPRDLATESHPGTDSESYAFTGTISFEANDRMTLTNITNYRSFETSLFQDLDLSAVHNSLQANGQATTVQERRIDSEQYSNEFQINFSDRFVDAVMGLYYFHERQRPRDSVGLARRNGMASNIPILEAAGVDLAEAYGFCGYSPGTSPSGLVIAPKRVCIHSNLGTDAYAAFGQAIIDLGAFSEGLSNFSLKLGGRYSYEEVESSNPAIIIAANGRGPVLRFTTEGTFRKRSFSDFTPEAGLEWRPNDDILVYYTYSEGFKAGSGENAAGSTTIVDPEQITNHEVGFRATFFDRRLNINLAAFSYELEGAQLNKTISGGPAGFTTIFENAAQTSAEGFELEILTVPMPNLRLSGAVAYTDAQYDDFLTLDPLNPANVATPGSPPYDPVTNPDPTAFGAPGGGEMQLAGNQVRNTPRWAWNIHGEFDIPLAGGSGGEVTLQGDVYGRSRVYFSEYQREIESSDGYVMADASIRYTDASERFMIQAWIRNAFDVLRPASTFALATGRLIGVAYLPPRTYGITAGVRF